MFARSVGGGAELRFLEPRHAAEFLAFVDANRAHLSERVPWGQTIRTVEDARLWLQRGVDGFAQSGLPWFGIWQDGAMAGGVLFFPLEEGARSTEVGYWLGADFVGRGLVTRALEAALEYAFDEIGVNRVGLEAEPDNVRSRAVAERLGFVYEGTRRQVRLFNGRLVDHAAYSLLADEWRTLRSGSTSATPVSEGDAMNGVVVHYEFPAADADRAQEFWSGLFGWSFGDSGMPGMDYRMAKASEEAGVAIYASDEPGKPNFYFDTDDIEASIVKVRELGGTADEKMPVPTHGWFAACKDSEGNTFHLWQSDTSAG